MYFYILIILTLIFHITNNIKNIKNININRSKHIK